MNGNVWEIEIPVHIANEFCNGENIFTYDCDSKLADICLNDHIVFKAVYPNGVRHRIEDKEFIIEEINNTHGVYCVAKFREIDGYRVGVETVRRIK